jgi:large subunit ribosomal protein L29
MKVAEQLNDLRGQTAEDLLRRAGELEEQVFRLRLQSSMGQGEAGNKIRPLRKELARLRTILREKDKKD